MQGSAIVDDLDEHGLVRWPAPERNKQPILEQLLRVMPGNLPEGALFLEIASGTGQHIAHFASHFPRFRFQPSDLTSEHLQTIELRRTALGLANVNSPILLNAESSSWPIVRADVIYNANMVHIAPWSVAEGLFAGAGRILGSGGLLLTYGPYKIDGEHTSESNERFDCSLKERDSRWGVRDLTLLRELAERSDIELVERTPMPANNFFVVWRRR